MKFPRQSLLASAHFAAALAAAQTEAPVAPPGEGTRVTIPALVAEISSRNPELTFYAAEIAAARAGARSAGALDNPEVALDFGRKRVRDLAGNMAASGTAWSVSVTQTFEWPGRLALRKAIANRNVQLAELGLARFQNALAGRARTLAFGLHAAEAKAAAVREVAERFAALKETFLARDPAGLTPLLETRVIEASELALQRRATEAELQLQAALLELNQLRGVAPGEPLAVAAPGFRFNTVPSTAALLGAARENNFEFRLRRLEIEQQGFEVRLARNERFPAVSVSPFYSQERAGDRESIAGIGLSVPVPVNRRTRSAVEIAEARLRQAQVAALVAERELEREVLTAAQAFAAKSRESGRWSSDAIARFREAAELADRHYRLGTVPIATYVELQNSYIDAAEALLDTQREALEAGLRLQQLTGLDLNPVEITP